jgi:hypothetical protein
MKKRAQMKRWTDEPAKVSGAPFSGPLPGKRYENIDRRSKLEVVERANNSTFLGFGTAVVNGKPQKGFYFQATRGSAEGIGWTGGMKVFALPGTSDRYFAVANRAGLPLVQASVLARRVLRLARQVPELQRSKAAKTARQILKAEAQKRP